MTLLRYFSLSLSAVSLVVYNVFSKNITNMLSIRQNPSSTAPRTFHIIYECALACFVLANLLQLVLGSEETFNTNAVSKRRTSQQQNTAENSGEKNNTEHALAEKLPIIANLAMIMEGVLVCVWSWIMSVREVRMMICLIITVAMSVLGAVPVAILFFSRPSETPKRLNSLTLFVRKMFHKIFITSPLCVFVAAHVCTIPLLANGTIVENTGTSNCTQGPIIWSLAVGVCLLMGILAREFGASLVAFSFTSANAALHRSIDLTCGNEMSTANFTLMILCGAVSTILAVSSLMDMNKYTNYYRTSKDIQQDLQMASESLNLNATIELANPPINPTYFSKVQTPSGGLIKTIRNYKEKRRAKKNNNKDHEQVNSSGSEKEEHAKHQNHHKYDNGLSVTEQYLDGYGDAGQKSLDESYESSYTNETEEEQETTHDNLEAKNKPIIDSTGFTIPGDNTMNTKNLKHHKHKEPNFTESIKIATHHTDSVDEDIIAEFYPEQELSKQNRDNRESIPETVREDKIDNNNNNNNNNNLDPVVTGATLSPNFSINILNTATP